MRSRHCFGALLFFLLGAAVAGASARDQVVVFAIDEAIGPATSDYFRRGLTTAVEREAALVVVRVNTPGGLDDSMREIVRAILASPIPVVVFVAPSGARAASAGTYIAYAAHLVAMAPATNLGAATPVALGGGVPFFAPDRDAKNTPGKNTGDKNSRERGGSAPNAGDPIINKAVNDAVAYLRGLAQLRGRNVEWAERAVRDGASLSAEEALAMHVIELIVPDLDALLIALNGRELTVQGSSRPLRLKQVEVEMINPDWRNRVLAIITDPNIAYLLMIVGFYGVFFELASPGYVLPGVVGAICLLLAFYALNVLPVNYAGLALVLLGIAFIIGEIYAPSFGALGIGGVISFLIGSIILFERDAGAPAVSLPLIAGFALLSGAFFIGVSAFAIKLHRRTAVSGVDRMIGGVAVAIEDFSAIGMVRTGGETWQARASVAVGRGQALRITGIDGLTLEVEPIHQESWHAD